MKTRNSLIILICVAILAVISLRSLVTNYPECPRCHVPILGIYTGPDLGYRSFEEPTARPIYECKKCNLVWFKYQVDNQQSHATDWTGYVLYLLNGSDDGPLKPTK